MKTFKISNKIISNNNKAFIIAEVGLSHMGSLNLAHSYISAAARSGADAVKFQMHIAEEESTLDEKFRVKISSQFKSRYDYWKKTSFTNDEWAQIIKHCQKEKIIFLCTPFSVKAAEILNNFDIEAFKIGSGEILFHNLFDYLKTTNKPILFSTGLSSTIEIDQVVKRIKHTNPFAIFQCTSFYPTPPEKIGLDQINRFKKKYKCPVGLSDHTGHIFGSIAAMALGASLIEVHVAFSKEINSPDSSSSISFLQLKELDKASRFLHACLSNNYTKDEIATELSKYRDLFFRSYSVKKNLKKGYVLKKKDLILKKPGTGIGYHQEKMILGRKLKKDLFPNRLIKFKDLE